MINGEKKDSATGGLPPPPRMVVSLAEFLPMLEEVTHFDTDIHDEREQLVERTGAIASHLAIVLTNCALELHELHARVSLLATALLAGDSLVSQGRLLWPGSGETFEGWIREAAVAQRDLAGVARDMSDRARRIVLP